MWNIKKNLAKKTMSLLLLLCTQVAFTQGSGICAGKVVEMEMDASENRSFEKNIVSAKVSLFKKDSLIASTLTTDAGVYRFDNLQQGEYSITIELAGYEKEELRNVKVWKAKVTLVRRTYLEKVTSEAENGKTIKFKKP